MKKKIKEELKNKSIAELITAVKKKVEAINIKRTEIKTGRAKDTGLKHLSDELAVIKTFLKEKQFKEGGAK